MSLDLHADVHAALEAMRQELRTLHQRIAPYPRSGCGLAERNLTHAFACALCARRPTLSVLHEMALSEADTASDARLDSVIFDDQVVVLVEAKTLFQRKSLDGLARDWSRLRLTALRAFNRWALPAERTVLRILIGDVWDCGRPQDAQLLAWLRQRCSGAIDQAVAWDRHATWWSGAQCPPSTHGLVAEVIRVDEVPDALRGRWTTGRAYHLWAAWRVDGAGVP